MTCLPPDAAPPMRRFDPEQTFALRLRGRAGAGSAPQPLAGRLEHVMSGRTADFADADQLIAALARLAGPEPATPPRGDGPAG